MKYDVQDRDLSHLKPEMQKRVKSFLSTCRSSGYNVYITEGLRSKQRQLHLYSQGRNIPTSLKIQYLGENDPDISSQPSRPVVTQTLQSIHLSGEAVDIAFEGEVLYPTDMSVWNAVYDIAESCGLKSLFRRVKWDKPHLEFDHTWVDPSAKAHKPKSTPKPKPIEKPTVHWAKGFEDQLLEEGLVSEEKNLDQPPSRAELYKLIVESRRQS